ncbi:MAG: triose-phosphate isomerase [Acidobacteriota bacterium]|nr:triose-phosphate isomerase [Acidobacteriota bacterium]
MRRRSAPFVAGNWKMYKTLPEAAALAGAIREAAPGAAPAELVVLPPFTSLAEAARCLAGSAVGLGAQNLHWESQGAFTGEISAAMLVDAGCRYVAVGHSERRHIFGESDADAGRKVRAALKAGLHPILCVGETLEEREAGRTFEVINRQLMAGLEGIEDGLRARVILAYEPVWAIGTGRTASPGQAEEVHAYIRGRLAQKTGQDGADCAIILYGGSVKPANAYSLFKERDIDGFLVGGASLEAESFLGIAREAVRAYKEVL